MAAGIGDIVESLGGRDKGKALYVMDVEGEFLVLVDGKSRRVEHPKRKKRKHTRLLSRGDSRVAEKLRSGEKVQNSEIRRALAAYAAGAGQTQGGL